MGKVVGVVRLEQAPKEVSPEISAKVLVGQDMATRRERIFS